MVMSWQPVDHPMTYEVQVRTTSPAQEFQQVRTPVVCRLETCELSGILLLDFTLQKCMLAYTNLINRQILLLEVTLSISSISIT